MWRKDLADTINATNQRLGIGVHWEHRSFDEQGIDKEPAIHIGAITNALIKNAAVSVKNEVLEMIAKVAKRKYNHYKLNMTVSAKRNQRLSQN